MTHGIGDMADSMTHGTGDMDSAHTIQVISTLISMAVGEEDSHMSEGHTELTYTTHPETMSASLQLQLQQSPVLVQSALQQAAQARELQEQVLPADLHREPSALQVLQGTRHLQ